MTRFKVGESVYYVLPGDGNSEIWRTVVTSIKGDCICCDRHSFEGDHVLFASASEAWSSYKQRCCSFLIGEIRDLLGKLDRLQKESDPVPRDVDGIEDFAPEDWKR